MLSVDLWNIATLSTRLGFRLLLYTWKSYCQFPSGRNFEAYKKIRHGVNALVREDEDTNTKRILQGFKSKPKRFYGYM